MNKLNNCMCLGVCRWACTHEHKCLQKLEERALDPLELEVQAVVSHLLWLPEAKLPALQELYAL